jgi:hypothetical protein
VGFVGFGGNEKEFLFRGNYTNQNEGVVYQAIYSYRAATKSSTRLFIATFHSHSKQVKGLSLKIVSPRDGEQIRAGQPYTIRWESKNIPSSAKFYFVLSDAQNRWTSEKVISEKVPNTGSFLWQVPPDVTAGAYVLRMASAVGVGEGGIISDRTYIFTVVNGPGVVNPVIDEITGPSVLRRRENGTWKVRARGSSEGEKLTYALCYEGWVCHYGNVYNNEFQIQFEDFGTVSFKNGRDMVLVFYVTNEQSGIASPTKTLRVTKEIFQ